jgi:hypothetical protein
LITYTYDARTLRQVERKLGLFKDQAPKALKNAINQTAKQARKELATEAQKTYTVKVGGFNKYMKLTAATQSKLEATIKATGEHIQMKKFSVYGGRNGQNLSVLINRTHGRKSFRDNAFVNNIARRGQTRKKDTAKGAAGSSVKHMAAAVRKGSSRLPINELYSVSIPQMIGNEKDVYGIVEPNIGTNLQDNISKQVAKILAG